MQNNYMKETWKTIIGYKGYYKVSNLGRIKSLPRIVPMSDGRKYKVKGKKLKPAFDGVYYHVALSKGSKERIFLVHRLVLETFVGPCPEGMESCHNDGNSANNTLDNLRWDTKKANQLDRVSHGTSCIGIKGNTYKLIGKSKRIKELYDSGDYTIASLAEMYDVSKPAIYYNLNKAEKENGVLQKEARHGS